MDKTDEEFLKRITETFRIEAGEHLKAFSAGLFELEKNQTEERYAEIIETLFREIHSLKGAARSVDQKDVESICQPLESVFSALKRKEFSLTSVSIDLFFKTVKSLTKLINELGSKQTAADKEIKRDLILYLNEMTSGSTKNSSIEEQKQLNNIESFIPQPEFLVENNEIPHKNESLRPKSDETVRIQSSKLDLLLIQSEELIQSKKAINQRIIELQDIHSWIVKRNSELINRNSTHHMDSITSFNQYNENEEIFLNKLESKLSEVTHSMERDQYSLVNMVDSHLEAVRKVIMLPVSTIIESFPGMVRELSHDQNKEIDFVVQGDELEMDKRILEELKDPLIHLIRNSIDHGISRPQERILQNKPPRGTIILSFTAHESGMIEITISDDGEGINKEQLIEAAIKSGNLTNEVADKLEPGEILKLIYQSGVSTSSFISEISGRGLGLSIVNKQVEKLNGRIYVETENKGTTFRIILPMTIATFRGILVKVQEFMFIFPTINVDRVLNLETENIITVENHETVLIDGRIISVVDLGEALGLPESKYVTSGKNDLVPGNSGKICMVVLTSGNNHIAFKVDEVIDEQQVLVKGLGKLLNRVRNISCATVLGSGKVVPVLHVPDLMKSAVKFSGKIKMLIKSDKSDDTVKKILVVDDSITSRTLIKNILETSGYQVSTAFDGADAFERARSDEFDLIISDVDMPRLNGFELTTRIRQDVKLKELPVVLITALGSLMDHERGIEVGADAYIIKSDFNQVNLLEVIRKLI